MEHSELPDDLDPQMAMELGTIELACYRVHTETRRVHQSRPKTPLFTSVDRISEGLLKGKDIENNIRLVCADFLSLIVAKRRLDTPMHWSYLHHRPVRSGLCLRARPLESRQCSNSITAPVVSTQISLTWIDFDGYRGPPNPRLHSSKRISHSRGSTRR